jgi:hypothetical protein
MILKWLFGEPTEKGDASPVEEPEPGFIAPVFVEPDPAPPTSLPTQVEICTSTATIVIYDLEALAHRLEDEIDWWADPKAELEELQNRNLLILGVQADGFYDVDLAMGEPTVGRRFSLRFPSGSVFVGPGEVMTGGGVQPNGHQGGVFLSVEAGDYSISVDRVDDERVSITLNRSTPFENDTSESVRI